MRRVLTVFLLCGCGEPPLVVPSTSPPGVRRFDSADRFTPGGTVWRVTTGQFPPERVAAADGLRRLRWDAKAGDAVVEAVLANPTLRDVNLPRFEASAVSLAGLFRKPGLRSLRIGDAPAWDDDVRGAVEATEAMHLHVIGSDLAADDVAAIGRAARLTSLYVDDCRAPDGAWRRLLSDRPDLHFHRDQLHLPGDGHEGG